MATSETLHQDLLVAKQQLTQYFIIPPSVEVSHRPPKKGEVIHRLDLRWQNTEKTHITFDWVTDRKEKFLFARVSVTSAKRTNTFRVEASSTVEETIRKMFYSDAGIPLRMTVDLPIKRILEQD